ncbi:MAG TPA: M28 family peptidase [Tepidisphaeraceae bacterium]|jgi:hypothetical protein|nr:M28 family peptidase [Tepidisphaeraceae bacterium]
MEDLLPKLRGHVDMLAELIGERNTSHPIALDATRAYLRRELTAMGHVVVDQPFETSRRTALNLEVHLPGSRPAKGTLIVGAHYDSAHGTPGADDNASAVAILLEIARDLARRKVKRTVRIVFFDCEEPPHFNLGEMGSQFHAAMLRRSGERLMGMVCLESLGYFPAKPQSRGDAIWILRLANRLLGGRFVAIVANTPSAWFGLRFLARFATSGWFRYLPAALPVRWVPDIALSDHRGYWEQGFPALMVTDTAHLRNPNYHQATDRLATLDIDQMARLCRQLQRTIARLCT